MTDDELLIEYLAAHIVMCLADQTSNPITYPDWVGIGEEIPDFMTFDDIKRLFFLSSEPSTIYLGQNEDGGDDIPF